MSTAWELYATVKLFRYQRFGGNQCFYVGLWKELSLFIKIDRTVD